MTGNYLSVCLRYILCSVSEHLNVTVFKSNKNEDKCY